MGNARGEGILAITGITAALRPGPMSITLKVLNKAQGLELAVRRRLHRFVREKSFAEMVPPPDFDWTEISQLLPGAEQEARQVENVSGFYDPALASDYAEALGAAIGYVQSIAPAELLPALVGGKSMEPSGLDVADFRRRYDVVERPLLALDDLAAGILMPDQVEVLIAVYPDLYAAIRTLVLEEMVAAGEARPSFELPYAKDQCLQILLGTETLDKGLAKELAKAFDDARERESGKPSGGPPAKPRKGIGDPSTQQERLEGK